MNMNDKEFVAMLVKNQKPTHDVAVGVGVGIPAVADLASGIANLKTLGQILKELRASEKDSDNEAYMDIPGVPASNLTLVKIEEGLYNLKIAGQDTHELPFGREVIKAEYKDGRLTFYFKEKKEEIIPITKL